MYVCRVCAVGEFYIVYFMYMYHACYGIHVYTCSRCVQYPFSLSLSRKVHGLVLDKLLRSQIVDSMVVVNWLFLPTSVSEFHKYEH